MTDPQSRIYDPALQTDYRVKVKRAMFPLRSIVVVSLLSSPSLFCGGVAVAAVEGSRPVPQLEKTMRAETGSMLGASSVTTSLSNRGVN